MWIVGQFYSSHINMDYLQIIVIIIGAIFKRGCCLSARERKYNNETGYLGSLLF